MRQIILIPVLCYLAFLVQFVLFNLFGRWGDPHLLLLVIIFFNLYTGIRFSLWAAVCAGILQDCFGTMPFGTHVFAYVACAYLSTAVRRYCYERGSDISKIWMVFCLVTAHAVIMAIVHRMSFEEVHWLEMWGSIWLPELLVTSVVALFVFRVLMQIVLWFRIEA